jgi:hypothetical protein
MNRRLKIVMDYENKIQPDGKTNWVAPNNINSIEWNVEQAANRGTLVLRVGGW